MNEFRQDPVSGRWVIVSADREHRPNQFRGSDSARDIEADTAMAGCPFCAAQMDTPPIVAKYGSSDNDQPWQVCVVPNKYPVIEPVIDPGANGMVAPQTDLLLSGSAAFGCHEVVIESPEHRELAGELTPNQTFYMLQAYRDRMLSMREMPGVRFVLPIKNSGRSAGASLRHTHSQLFGLPMVPEQVQRELDGSLEYYRQQGGCVFCDLMQAEVESGDRVVAVSDDFVAWCPYASRFSYEVWLSPREHRSRFEETDDRRLRSLGEILHTIIRQLDQSSRINAYNYLLHSLPFDSNRQDHYHWHIEILPRIAMKAGFEWGTGVHINTIVPTRAASELRSGSGSGTRPELR